MAVPPELSEHSRALIDQKNLQFEILRDPGNATAHAYGLKWQLPEDLKELYKTCGADLAEFNGEGELQAQDM